MSLVSSPLLRLCIQLFMDRLGDVFVRLLYMLNKAPQILCREFIVPLANWVRQVGEAPIYTVVQNNKLGYRHESKSLVTPRRLSRC